MEILLLEGEITQNIVKKIKEIKKRNTLEEFKRLWRLYKCNYLSPELLKEVFKIIKYSYDYEEWNNLIKQVKIVLEKNNYKVILNV